MIERMLFSKFPRVDIGIQIVYKGEGETGYRRRNARREHAVREIIGQKLITNSVSGCRVCVRNACVCVRACASVNRMGVINTRTYSKREEKRELRSRGARVRNEFSLHSLVT